MGTSDSGTEGKRQTRGMWSSKERDLSGVLSVPSMNGKNGSKDDQQEKADSDTLSLR